MGATVSDLVESHVKAGRSGLQLVADNNDAFAVRVLAARSAVRTLDLMYYLWRDDTTGRLLAQEVVDTADRGVRVRVLLDDINPRQTDAAYLALDQHPNIELRLFNPTGARNGSPLRALEFVARMFAMTRRMHNKAWIVDDKVAIVGGRNIGDAYFDAADTNFRDLDLLMLGPAALQAGEIFEAFWNCEASKPIRELNPLSRLSIGRAKPVPDPASTGATSKLMSGIGKDASLAEFIAASDDMHWTRHARVISDPPEKVMGRKRHNWLMRELMPVIEASKHRLDIVSPYFIPGKRGVNALSKLVDRGVDVAVLTNSLAATDVAAVHGAYANYRKKLLRNGIQLFELQRFGRKANISVFGSKGASLHTKAFSVDGKIGFIGSFNFDPRSVSLNSEMGVLFEEKALVDYLQSEFDREKSPDSSYRLVLRGERLHWLGSADGEPQDLTREPEAGVMRTLVAMLTRWLPLESQL